MSTELAVQAAAETGLAPIASVDQAVFRHREIERLKRDLMVAGIDYGVIPGTEKPTLYQAGADKLVMAFNLSPAMDLVEKVEDWTGAAHNGEPFFTYTYRCDIYRGGVLAGTCIGSANSFEKKYRFRDGQPKCPSCSKPAVYKGKGRDTGKYDGSFYCWNKKGGCGSVFPAGSVEADALKEQATGQIPNPEIFDLVNTIQKMAQKRAKVGAVNQATGAKSIFTEDLEDSDEVAGVSRTPGAVPETEAVALHARVIALLVLMAPEQQQKAFVAFQGCKTKADLEGLLARMKATVAKAPKATEAQVVGDGISTVDPEKFKATYEAEGK